MVAAGWDPTVATYLGRVTKARILDAVREAKGERAAELIDHLKKAELAEKAEAMLAGSGWLPVPLRTPGRAVAAPSPAPEAGAGASTEQIGVETVAVGCATAMVEAEPSREDDMPVADPSLAAAE